MALYNYIYVDLDKVISLYSQLTGGIVEARENTFDATRNNDNKRSYDFKVFKHDAGGTDQSRNGMKEIIKPHHSLLTELEFELQKNGYLLDLSDPTVLNSFKDEEFRNQLRNTFCVKITGRAVIEDYERMKTIARSFPEIAKLINKSIESGLRDSPEFLLMQSEIERLEEENRQQSQRENKNKKAQEIKNLKRSVESLLKTNSTVGSVEQWILDGFETWINTFLSGIVNLRIYPSDERPDEHVFGHLKTECFEELDSNSLHFTHGSLPTEDLTMIGIVTSVPMKQGENFNPLDEFQKDDLENHESVEKAFRGMFRGFDGFEQMIRTCRYPRVLVHPITVYRSVEANKNS